MSILIKGMEMPKGCIGCRFCEHGSINEWDLYCGIDNKHVGNWDDKHINNGWRRPDCPLTPVPTPHGRLIDGDVLLAFFNDAAMNTGMIGEAVLGGVCETIAVMPTIIEAEEGEEDEKIKP